MTMYYMISNIGIIDGVLQSIRNKKTFNTLYAFLISLSYFLLFVWRCRQPFWKWRRDRCRRTKGESDARFLLTLRFFTSKSKGISEEGGVERARARAKTRNFCPLIYIFEWNASLAILDILYHNLQEEWFFLEICLWCFSNIYPLTYFDLFPFISHRHKYVLFIFSVNTVKCKFTILEVCYTDGHWISDQYR